MSTKATRNIIAAIALVAFVSPASATVLTFEDLSGQAFMPSVYQGFSFNGWEHYDWAQPPYNPSSGVQRLYTYDPNSSITSSTDFVFNGAYFSGGDTNVNFSLYDDDVLVWTSSILAPTGTPTFLSSGYGGFIDKIVVNGSLGLFVMDDFTYNGSPNAVPLPAAAPLMLTGLGLLAAAARRRKARVVEA